MSEENQECMQEGYDPAVGKSTRRTVHVCTQLPARAKDKVFDRHHENCRYEHDLKTGTLSIYSLDKGPRIAEMTATEYDSPMYQYKKDEWYFVEERFSTIRTERPVPRGIRIKEQNGTSSTFFNAILVMHLDNSLSVTYGDPQNQRDYPAGAWKSIHPLSGERACTVQPAKVKV